MKLCQGQSVTSPGLKQLSIKVSLLYLCNTCNINSQAKNIQTSENISVSQIKDAGNRTQGVTLPKVATLSVFYSVTLKKYFLCFPTYYGKAVKVRLPSLLGGL